MDRISALRNVEDALADFEDGDATLGDVEDRVLGVLRAYATEFEDWLAAECTRADAVELTGAGDREFALAATLPDPGAD